jgi:hypothetical protein
MGEITRSADDNARSAKGVAPLRSAEIDGQGGERLALGLERPGETGQIFPSVVAIPFRAFDRCPICLTAEPDQEEHVPQGQLGGTVRTMTCQPCNNRLGGRIEPQLVDYVHRRATRVTVEAPGFRGRRAAPLLVRFNSDGQAVPVLETITDPVVIQMLETGQARINPPSGRHDLHLLGALKHAYLAACCYLGEIPNGSAADQIRADLVAARDARKPVEIPRSAIAESLDLYLGNGTPTGPPLGIAWADTADGVEVVISLAGVAGVSWPLPDPPEPPARLR